MLTGDVVSGSGRFLQQLACLRQEDFRAAAPVEGPGPFTSACDGPITMWVNDPIARREIKVTRTINLNTLRSEQGAN